MADTKTSALTAATALTGAELFAGVQGATSKKVTADQIKTFATAGLGGGSVVAVAAPIAFTGTTTAASNQLTAISSMTGLAVGQQITGVGIIAGTTISALNVGASSLTLSQNASETSYVAAATAITAYPLGTAGLVPAPPARNRSRQVLGASGLWTGREPRSWLYNFDDPRRLRRYRAALGAVMSQRPFKDNALANTGRRVLFFGDSMFMGNEPNIPHWSMQPPAAAFNILNAASYGGVFRYANIMGSTASGDVENTPSSYEDRISAAAPGWDANNIYPGLSAVFMSGTSSVDLVLSEPTAWDRATIFYCAGGNGNDWTYKIGSESAVAVSGISPDQLIALPITAAVKQVQTLKFARTAGFPQIVGVEFYDSAKLQMRAINLASGGSGISGASGLVANTMTGVMSPANLKTVYDPALVVLSYGYEISGLRASPPANVPGTPAATVVANWVTAMNTYIAAWKAQGVDVLIASMHPWDDTNLYKDQATVEMAREAFYAVCDANDVPGIDNFMRWGTWTEAVATGLISHYARPLPAGNYDLGSAIAQALSSI